MIHINPVSQVAAIGPLTYTPQSLSSGKPLDTAMASKESKAGESKCNSQYPTAIMVGLGAAVVCLLVAEMVVFQKIKQYKDQMSEDEKEMTPVADSDSQHARRESHTPLQVEDPSISVAAEDRAAHDSAASPAPSVEVK